MFPPPHPHFSFILCAAERLTRSWIGPWQPFALKAFLTSFIYRLSFLFLRLALPARPLTSWSAPRHFQTSFLPFFLSNHTHLCFSHMELSVPLTAVWAHSTVPVWSRACLCLECLSPILHLSSSSFSLKFTINPSSPEPLQTRSHNWLHLHPCFHGTISCTSVGMLFAYYKFKKIYSPISLPIRRSFDILAQYQRPEGTPYMLKEWKYLSNGYFVEPMAFALES